MSEYTLGDVKKKLTELGVFPKKSLGQNFLINKKSCESIVGAALKVNPSKIVEVGPGLGALTELFPKDKLILIELDKIFAGYWQSRGYETIERDALDVDWETLRLPLGTILVSNLPYQISSRLVIDRGLGPREIDKMILMFQKEVAQRFLAKPDTETYGLLTVVASAYWGVEKLFEVSSKDFYPPPQVASQVLIFRRKPVPPSASFVAFVKLAFGQRRKFLVKNLGANYSLSDLKVCLGQLGLDEKVRAEVLSPDQFVSLFKMMSA